ncbi:unnamed protein product [Victoria cruziana]
MAPFEALYRRPCRTHGYWSDIVDVKREDPLVLQHYTDQVYMIRDKLRPCSYIFVDVSPTKGIFRFGRKGMLSSRYIGPFEIVKRIGPTAYKLALPPHLSQIYDVFHISMLNKYLPNPNKEIEYTEVQVNKRLNVPEIPVCIVDEQIRTLKNKQIPIVKVEWQHQGIQDYSWVTRASMENRYPHLFS